MVNYGKTYSNNIINDWKQYNFEYIVNKIKKEEIEMIEP